MREGLPRVAVERTVLVLGASGFIGARVALAARKAGWTVRAGTRTLAQAQRRAPGFQWVEADFNRLRTAEAWRPLLEGVDAVINCVGVLQDAPGDSSRIAHVEAPAGLIQACEPAGVRRLVHISAVGVGEGAGTHYARDKARAEALLQASGLDWVVVRPSLVLAREVYGGTAMFRGLAGLPFGIPVLEGEAGFRPIAAEDLADLVVGLAEPSAPARRIVEGAGPERVSLAEVLTALRAWLGFGPVPVIPIPVWLAAPALACGDLAAWLGWRSSFRTTSLRQLRHDAAGQGPASPGVRGLSEILAAEPASVQDRWHARLYFLRPLSVLTLSLFWLATGLIDLGPGRQRALQIVRSAGLDAWAQPVVVLGGGFDIVLGAALLVRPLTRAASLAMFAASIGYLIAATVLLPGLWSDPLGPWLKVLPMMALCLVVAATDDRR